MSDVETIRCLNDKFRRSLTGGRIMLTAGVQALPQSLLAALLARLKAFELFTDDNDPHGEHDFGAIDLEGQKYFFKIDYYDPNLRQGSEDPADPAKTVRVLTLMRADEY